MRISKLITGQIPEATAAWQGVFDGSRDDERLLWYPGAGSDFRDILEMHPTRREINGVTEVPDLYVHTDYDAAVMPEVGVPIIPDERTTVDVVESHDLQIAADKDVQYEVSADYARERGRAFPEARMRLLRVRATSVTLGSMSAWVVYAGFETFNFFTEVLLKHRVKVTHLVKVRDGSDMGGGGRVCGSTLYPFLGALGVRHLFADDHVVPNREVVEDIWRKLGPRGTRSGFRLVLRGRRLKWSDGLAVGSYAVVQREGEMMEPDLRALWSEVGRP